LHTRWYNPADRTKQRGLRHPRQESSVTQISIHRVIQSIAGTVMARASVEIKSIDAASDWADLYRAAKSTTTVASGKLVQINASRENGLRTSSKRSRMNSIAACTATRAREPARTPAESRIGCAASTSPTLKTATPEGAEQTHSTLLVKNH